MHHEDPGSWGPGIIGIAAVLEALLIIVIALRIYTRVWIAKAFWWDDFTILLAALGTTIGAALCFVNVHYGFGTHLSHLNSTQIRLFRKYTFGEWIQTFATLMWTKISICLFFVRMRGSKKYKNVMYWAVGFLLLSNTVLTVMWIMQCQPVRAAWTQGGEGRGCMGQRSKEAIILTQAVISIVSDFVFAGVPVLLLWRLQIDLKTKVGLWVLMCLGVITGACCIVRTVLNGEALPVDETYDGIVNWVWRTFEVQIGIIAACVPTLRPLYSRCRGWARGEGWGKGNDNMRFLDVAKGGRTWVEDAEMVERGLGKSPSNLATRGNSQATGTTPQPTRNQSANLSYGHCAMEQDLIAQGILKKPTRNESVGAGTDGMPEAARSISDPELQDDLDRYGISTRGRLASIAP